MRSRLRFPLAGLIATLLALQFPATSSAQRVEGGLHLMLGNPQGEFRQNVDNMGFGLSGFLALGPKNGFALFGGEFGFLVYGTETRKEPFSTTIPDVTVDVTTTNNLAMGHLLARLQIPTGPVQPYVDGLVGFHYLYTQTTIKNEHQEEEIATSTNFSDFTYSYGGAGGIKILIYHRQKEEKPPVEKRSSVRNVFVDFRVRYLAGGEADYLKKGSIRRENGKVAFDVKHSRTDLMTFQLGITVQF
ncbi:MAG TPA: hypothetical protein ENJ23_03175 [Bacteroidetes bacterium]|nr:hypothetical protein [Bacteroidota bacterium]